MKAATIVRACSDIPDEQVGMLTSSLYLGHSDQSVPLPDVVRLWAMVFLIGGERGQDLRWIKNGRSVKGHLYRVNYLEQS